MEKQQNTKLQDEGRLAHMIAWRDKRIAFLESLIAAHEQANGIYAAYITYLLERCNGKAEHIRIPKATIRSVCGKYAVRAEDDEDDFIIYLTEPEDTHGQQCSKMADA